MAAYHELLGRAQLSVVSAEDDPELDAVARTITGSVRVGGRRALSRLLGGLLAAQRGRDVVPKTLDLYGHSTARTAQLLLGDWVVDAVSPAERRFFRALATRAVLARLGIRSVRLLACRTADTEAGRATIGRLAEALGVEVYGTRHLLYDAHHDDQGFLAAWQFLLVSATELRRDDDSRPGDEQRRDDESRLGDELRRGDESRLGNERRRADQPTSTTAAPRAQTFATPTGPRPPRRLAPPAAAAQILALVQRDAGAPMLGAVQPSWELVLPTDGPGTAQVAHVLLDGAFVQLYPDGRDAPGVSYPVTDPGALRRIMATLSPPPD